MTIWNKIKGLFTRSASPEAPAASPRLGGAYLPFFGGSQNALNIATVFRCVKLLSEGVANLPILYMQLRGGIFEEDRSDPINYLLNVRPNRDYNAFDFWAQVVHNMLLDGNAYIVPEYSSASLKIERLVLCSRGSVAHDTYSGRYKICDLENGISGDFDEKDVIHIKNMSLDGKTGLSTLSYARLTTSIASAGDNETLNRFVNGGNVRGLVKNNASVTGFGEYRDGDLNALAGNLDDRFRNGEHIISLPGEVDFKQISLSSTDMQFLESRKFTVREICRFFGVHPSFVFDDTSNNYKSAEMANVAFLSNTLNPILRKIETELRSKLIAPSICHKRKFQFDRKGLYACDLESRVKYQAQTIAAGIYTVNEWRAEENRPPVEGGDKVMVSANLKDINDTSAIAPSAAESGNGGKNEGEGASKNNSNEE